MNSGIKLAVLLGVLALGAGIGAAALLDEKKDQKKDEKEKIIESKTGLKYIDHKEGLGDAAKDGDEVTVHYTGWLTNGKKFDSSHDRKEPFTFNLGAGRVIKGWDEGVAGMKVGGKRKLMIPANLAYGDRSPSPDIPPNSDLVFEVELLRIKSGK